jgi:2',3'-cyclic-nucleotide 2'-phosphodiesterase (5'-nucleotidase family)
MTDSLQATSMAASTEAIILPFRTALDEEMNIVIGTTTGPLEKDQPEGTLGNFVADAALSISNAIYQKSYQKNIDFAFFNNGGLRNPLPQGTITMRNAFELMPFENQVVVITLDGSTTKKVLDFIFKKGGVPVSGLRMTLSDGQHTKTTIQGEPFDSTRNYTIITSDYLANGGDDLHFLATAANKTYIDLKLRDAIITYFKQEQALGRPIVSKLDKRIQYGK